MNDYQLGRALFYRGKVPQPEWSGPMYNGWLDMQLAHQRAWSQI
jgi:hypothetical protein